MFRYRKVAGFQSRPNHATLLEGMPALRDEDVSFYGLLTFTFEENAIHPNQLPGTKDFLFTDRDRAVLSQALKRAGITSPHSHLEICTISEADTLVESQYFAFAGRCQHGLQIVERSLGICSLGNAVKRMTGGQQG